MINQIFISGNAVVNGVLTEATSKVMMIFNGASQSCIRMRRRKMRVKDKIDGKIAL